MYRGYTFFIHPEKRLFRMKICFIKRGGLTVTSSAGYTDDEAIEEAKRKIDVWLGDQR